MPPSHTDEGLRAAAVEARRRVPRSPVLVLSQHVEVSYADDLLDGVGAVGYLLKDRVSAVTDFLDAVNRVVSGGAVLDPMSSHSCWCGVAGTILCGRYDPT